MSSAAEPTQPPASPAEGKSVALVTGASGGIGTGLVAAFRHAGYSVVATSLSIGPSDDHDILAVQSDITEVGPAQRVVKQAVDRFGRIDTLINTAGIFIGKPFTDYTLDDYKAIMAVNLAGFFHITQPVIRHMLTQGTGGHIVNITTSLVDHPDSTRPSALASLTKGGLAAVTRSLAIEYASRRHQDPIHDPSSYEGMAALHPLGRIGEVSDIIDAILYLEGATFVTGEILHVDGGQAAGHVERPPRHNQP